MPHLIIQPLLGFDFTEIAITAVVLFFAVMKKLFDASSNAAKKGAATMPAQPPQRMPGPAPKPPAAAGGQQADALRSQVEEFLRRAGGAPQTNQAPAPTQRPVSEIEVLVKQPQRSPPPQSFAGSRPMPSAMPSAGGKKQRGGRRGQRRQSVAEHVAQNVTTSTQTFAENASHLGQRIATEDLQFDNQVKSKFDHTLGTLGEAEAPPSSVVTPRVETPASRIAAMLANPAGVQQAVMMNEIMRRPSDRW